MKPEPLTPLLHALRTISEQSCRPLYGSDGSKLDDVHELECPACIARHALRRHELGYGDGSNLAGEPVSWRGLDRLPT